MSRRRATRPLMRYSLWPERYNRRPTTTSPGLACTAGLSAVRLRRPGLRPADASAPSALSVASAASFSRAPPAVSSSSLEQNPSDGEAASAAFSADWAAPSIMNRAASASSGSSRVIITSERPMGGRLAVPLKMQSDMRSARRDLWLCSPRTQEMASTTLDLPQPLGPTMHVVPLPLNVIAVRSQNDLKPIRSTLRSLSKCASPGLYDIIRRNMRPAQAETKILSSSGGGNARQKQWQVPSQWPSRLALRKAVRGET